MATEGPLLLIITIVYLLAALLLHSVSAATPDSGGNVSSSAHRERAMLRGKLCRTFVASRMNPYLKVFQVN